MSDDKTTAKPKEPDEPKFPLERILDEAEAMTGQRRHVVEGALHGRRETEFTKTEVQRHVEKWLASPVATEG